MPAGQARPHIPQFAASRWRSKQVAPQSVCPDAQNEPVEHIPLAQVCPAGHAIVVKVIPSELHTRRSAVEVQVAVPGVQPGARHSPATQDSPAAQGTTA